jgi:hypothetical protein
MVTEVRDLSVLLALQVCSIQRTKHVPYMLASVLIEHSIAITFNEEKSQRQSDQKSTTTLQLY